MEANPLITPNTEADARTSVLLTFTHPQPLSEATGSEIIALHRQLTQTQPDTTLNYWNKPYCSGAQTQTSYVQVVTKEAGEGAPAHALGIATQALEHIQEINPGAGIKVDPHAKFESNFELLVGAGLAEPAKRTALEAEDADIALTS